MEQGSKKHPLWGEKSAQLVGTTLQWKEKNINDSSKKVKKHPLADFEKDHVQVDPSHKTDKGNELYFNPDDDDDDDYDYESNDKEPTKTTVYYFNTEAENSGEHICNCVCIINQGCKKVF